tara:strand:+ start:410 stop:1249 length:840 start_codon:yes stop_codon:yes gene_type:complete
VDKRLQNKNERAINKRNVDLIIAREEAKIKKRQMKERTGNPKIDGPLEDFEKVYGYKIGSKFDEKINAMKDGGVATPKKKPKNFTKTVEKQKRDKAIASGQLNIGDFNEMTPSMMEDFYKDASKVKRKKFGGKVQKMREGGSAMSDADRAMIQALLGESGKTISDADRARMARMMGESGKTISDADRAKMMMSSGIGKGMKYGGKVKKMKVGGEAVPSKFKGFSKLPEGVQQKIDPKLASKYEMGGKVEKYGGGGKVKGGKMSCRGMGAAIKGGGFSIR